MVTDMHIKWRFYCLTPTNRPRDRSNFQVLNLFQVRERYYIVQLAKLPMNTTSFVQLVYLGTRVVPFITRQPHRTLNLYLAHQFNFYAACKLPAHESSTDNISKAWNPRPPSSGGLCSSVAKMISHSVRTPYAVYASYAFSRRQALVLHSCIRRTGHCSLDDGDERAF